MFALQTFSIAALVLAVAVAFGLVIHHIHVTDHRDEMRARWIAYAKVTRARRRHFPAPAATPQETR